KECYHILRDRRTLAVLIFMPIVQVVLFGFSIRTDVTDVRLVIVDPTPDATTLALRDRFNGGGVFRTVAVLPTAEGLDPLFERDTAQVAVEFPPNFGSTLAAGDNARILIVTDATEPNGGIQRQAFVTQVVQQLPPTAGCRRPRCASSHACGRASIQRGRARICSCPASWRWCSTSSPR